MAACIGIDYTPAYEQGGGIGRYVRELTRALARIDETTEYRLFVSGVNSHDGLPLPPGANFRWHSTRISPLWLARLWHRVRIPFPIEAWLGNIDLLHATDFVLPPTRTATRTILTVHDLSFVHLPETASPALKRYLDRVVPRSVRLANHILADSQATKDDLIALYDTPAAKITVLLSGVDTHFKPVTDQETQRLVREAYGLGEWPFIFTVGTVQPRKNYGRLCEALALLRNDFPDLRLVIAGGKGWLEDPIYASVEKLNLQDRVHFIGYASDDDLPVLYTMAEVVPFVSLYEGFGLPVLEAMACGTPVVASNISSIPEVAGDATLLVDPVDIDAIAAALGQVLSDSALRYDLTNRGMRRAAQFTWENAAKQLRNAYFSVLDT